MKGFTITRCTDRQKTQARSGSMVLLWWNQQIGGNRTSQSVSQPVRQRFGGPRSRAAAAFASR